MCDIIFLALWFSTKWYFQLVPGWYRYPKAWAWSRTSNWLSWRPASSLPPCLHLWLASFVWCRSVSSDTKDHPGIINFFPQCHLYWQPISQRGSALNLGAFRDERWCWRSERCETYLTSLIKEKNPKAVTQSPNFPFAVGGGYSCGHSGGGSTGWETSENDFYLLRRCSLTS